MSDHASEYPKALFADHLTLARCASCRSIHLRLHDEHGAIFAVASMPIESAADFHGDLGRACVAMIFGCDNAAPGRPN